MDHIDFITEDGQMESCEVNRKTIHEAFLYIEKAAAPYITRRKEQLVSYVLKRTEDFHMVFGIDEQIEINEERGVFHILRQGGSGICKRRLQCPLSRLECSMFAQALELSSITSK